MHTFCASAYIFKRNNYNITSINIRGCFVYYNKLLIKTHAARRSISVIHLSTFLKNPARTAHAID